MAKSEPFENEKRIKWPKHPNITQQDESQGRKMTNTMTCDKIDRNIRPLVDEFNRMPGVTTFSSCEGHEEDEEDEETFVAFTVENIDALRKVSMFLDAILTEMLGYETPPETSFRGRLEVHGLREDKIALKLAIKTNDRKWRLRVIRYVTARMKTNRLLIPEIDENKPQLTVTDFRNERTLSLEG